jgi:hypothetical protein
MGPFGTMSSRGTTQNENVVHWDKVKSVQRATIWYQEQEHFCGRSQPREPAHTSLPQFVAFSENPHPNLYRTLVILFVGTKQTNPQNLVQIERKLCLLSVCEDLSARHFSLSGSLFSLTSHYYYLQCWMTPVVNLVWMDSPRWVLSHTQIFICTSIFLLVPPLWYKFHIGIGEFWYQE